MAKSIDEMAKIECCNDVDIAYFKYGANAVLEVIEKTLDLGEPPYLISVERAYYITKELIRELRGE